jgi:hypothetical protein
MAQRAKRELHRAQRTMTLGKFVPLLGLVAVVCLSVLSSAADARRPATPAEKSAMLAALRADLPSNGALCYARFRVSTINPRYGMATCAGELNVLLVRSGSHWFVRYDGASGWFCDDPYRTGPPRVMKELLRPAPCLSTQDSFSFVTPSNNIACAYRPGNRAVLGQRPGKITCYVRSSRTLASALDIGAGGVSVRREADAPENLQSLNGPVLPYGFTWRASRISEDGVFLKCIARSDTLRCEAGRGSGFLASRSGVRLLP